MWIAHPLVISGGCQPASMSACLAPQRMFQASQGGPCPEPAQSLRVESVQGMCPSAKGAGPARWPTLMRDESSMVLTANCHAGTSASWSPSMVLKSVTDHVTTLPEFLGLSHSDHGWASTLTVFGPVRSYAGTLMLQTHPHLQLLEMCHPQCSQFVLYSAHL